jgi:hypothetical protein
MYRESGGLRLTAGEAIGEMMGSGWGTILPKAHHIVLASTFTGGDK